MPVYLFTLFVSSTTRWCRRVSTPTHVSNTLTFQLYRFFYRFNQIGNTFFRAVHHTIGKSYLISLWANHNFRLTMYVPTSCGHGPYFTSVYLRILYRPWTNSDISPVKYWPLWNRTQLKQPINHFTDISQTTIFDNIVYYCESVAHRGRNHKHLCNGVRIEYVWWPICWINYDSDLYKFEDGHIVFIFIQNIQHFRTIIVGVSKVYIQPV